MVYRVTRALGKISLCLLRRWKIIGHSRLIDGQGMIVVSNHTSNWDALAIGCALDRQVFFMAKAELYDIPILGYIITKLGTFPVQRKSVDRSSIRTALKLLDSGKLVGIFPEGTRSKTEELLNPHLGAAMLALKGNVPILPLAVSGTKGFWRQIKVIIGEPMYFTAQNNRKLSKDELETVSREIMLEISRLLGVINNFGNK